MIKMVEDLQRVAEGSGKSIEFDIVPSDLPILLHLKVVNLFHCFGLQVCHSEVVMEFAEEFRPVVRPLWFIVIIV